MRRIITLFFVCAVLFIGPGVLAANPYMRRESDTISGNALYRLTSATASGQPSGDTAREKTLNLFAWFEPDDSENVRADSGIISDAEARTSTGVPNSGQYLETIKIYSRSSDLGLKYTTRLDGEDFGPEATGLYDTAEVSGNTGSESQKVNNLKIRLDGRAALENNIFYRVFMAGAGWSAWAVNGAPVVAEDQAIHIESLEIRILPSATPAPPATISMEGTPVINMRAHQAFTGWTPFIIGKDISVDSEDNPRRLEALQFSTSDPNLTINYQVLVPDSGWSELVKNNTKVGTTGQSRALEAVRISLSGDKAADLDLYYRVKVEGYGWLDWANNGQLAGTENQGLGIQAIQVRLLPKGSSAPGRIEHPGVSAVERVEGEVLKQINILRLQKGLNLLTGNKKLHDASDIRAGEVYISFSHTRPNGSSYETALNEVGYRGDGLRPASGESILKTNDPGRIYRSLIVQQTCLKMLLTDYYQYFALSTHEALAESSILLFSDTINEVD